MQIYKVEHNWADDETPTEYLMACGHWPTDAEAVAACGIDFEGERGEFLKIEMVEVHGAQLLVDVGRADWDQLRKQKQELVHLALAGDVGETCSVEALDGVVNFLDSIQDQAAETLGDKAVFGHDPEEISS